MTNHNRAPMTNPFETLDISPASDQELPVVHNAHDLAQAVNLSVADLVRSGRVTGDPDLLQYFRERVTQMAIPHAFMEASPDMPGELKGEVPPEVIASIPAAVLAVAHFHGRARLSQRDVRRQRASAYEQGIMHPSRTQSIHK